MRHPRPLPSDIHLERSVNDRLGFSLASDFVGCSAMSEPEEGAVSRRVKGACRCAPRSASGNNPARQVHSHYPYRQRPEPLLAPLRRSLGVRRLRRLVSAYRRPSSCRKPTSMRSLSSAAAMRPAQRASRTHPNRVLLIRTPALPTQPRTAPRRSFGVVSLAFADWEADRRPTV